jgi:hypothetical protein
MANLAGVVGDVVEAVIKSPLEITNPNKILSGDGVLGYILFMTAFLFIVIVICQEFEWSRLINYLPSYILDFVNTNASVTVMIIISMFFGIVANRRYNRFQKTGNFLSLISYVGGHDGGGFFGGEDSYPNHPFFVTGSSEYNDKTVSDNYLPTL